VCAASGPLVDGTNPIPDSYMTATSEWSALYVAPMARMSSGGAWWAADAETLAPVPNFYMQVSSYYYYE